MVAFAATATSFAENIGSVNLPDDSTKVMTLDDIVSMETDVQEKKKKALNSQKTWNKNTFFNISKNIERLSSDDFPTAKESVTSGKYSAHFKNKFGLGLQWGRSFNFHKRPIGDVAFIGIDYTWLDLNYSQYKAEKLAPAQYDRGSNEPYSQPWHNDKDVVNYGMSLGPSLTLYPLAPLGISATNKLRIQVYGHIGASGQLAILKKFKKTDTAKEENAYIAGYDVFTGIGANLTWNFIGIGYELRRTYTSNHYPQGKDFNNSTLELYQQFNRLYLQFRF